MQAGQFNTASDFGRATPLSAVGCAGCEVFKAVGGVVGGATTDVDVDDDDEDKEDGPPSELI